MHALHALVVYDERFFKPATALTRTAGAEKAPKKRATR